MTMKSKKTYAIFGFIILIIAFSVILYKQHDRKEIIRITQEWANLTSFPENAKIISAEKLGSMFTREFRVKFTAPEKDIRKWLSDSPGTSQATPDINGGIEKYSIKPAGGAQFAEVIYNIKTNEIYIRVYWS